MAEKRKSMKGKGAEIFLGDSTKNSSGKSKKGHSDRDEEKHSRISERENGRKEKAGFYLSSRIIEELELVWVKARNLTGNKVSKSDIVKVALESVIKEFNNNPTNSELVQKLS